MLPSRDSRITKIALIVFFLLIIVYGYFEVRGLLFGPTITVTSQINVVNDPFVTIRGHADRISSLMMNGTSVPVTESGAFNEPFVLAPGDNHIMLDAADKYGRKTQTVIEIVYVPSATTTAIDQTVSTSTATGTKAKK